MITSIHISCESAKSEFENGVTITLERISNDFDVEIIIEDEG